MEMSLETQKLRVMDLKSQLDLMINRAEIIKQDLNGQLDLALKNGLPVETYQKYKSHFLSRLCNDLDTLTHRIQHDDMGYLNDVQVHIQDAINQ